MDSEEYLLTSTNCAQHWSCALYNPHTTNLIKTYKNGGITSAKTLQIIGDDYIIAAEQSKPILHVWQLNSQEVNKNARLILPEPTSCLAVCPKNVYIAAGIGRKLYVWKLDGKLLSVTKKHFQPITCLTFSSDGQFLAVAGDDGILLIYKLADLVAFNTSYTVQKNLGQVEPLHTITQNSMGITDMFTGKFGKKSRLVTVSGDQSCRIYTFSTGVLLLNLVANEPLMAVIIDLTCWNVFVGCLSGVIKQFSLKSPPRVLTKHLEDNTSTDFIGHNQAVKALSINMTNTILASGSDDKSVILWEIKSRQVLKKLEYNSVVTNLMFVKGFKNFTVESFKPKIILKNLERNVDEGNYNFVCAIYQNEDLELSDDENCLEKTQQRESLTVENRRLRTVNKQLYDVALKLSNKYK